MKFLLEVDMADEWTSEEAARELGRILRYWGGNLGHYALKPGDGAAVYASGHQEAGRWRIVAADGT
ncbi:hypothetical protein [Streptomyces glomeratus]|uniref:Uncharacterized protein n=1 Tax=Streptomyces glomeratus TaxID=284452 RepID=A0ABP6LLV1_9ACTN|nr:hypothetical protein [Streptomyces glomeratus]MCF1509297.1 hypothetical protein [Streptomyces glomeratus]